MIVAIPVEDTAENVKVCPSFGRSAMYLIYDSVANSKVYMDNPAAVASGGAGVKASQFLVDAKVDAVITPRCGQNAAEVLQEAGITIYTSIDGTVQENLNCYLKGELTPLNSFHPGFHGHGGQ